MPRVGFSSHSRDSSKLHLLIHSDIKQAGGTGYPLTVNTSTDAGIDVKAYGKGGVHAAIEGGEPLATLEGGLYVVTPTLAYWGDVEADGSFVTLATHQYGQYTGSVIHNSPNFSFGQYAGADAYTTLLGGTTLSASDFTPSPTCASRVFETLENYNTFGIVHYDDTGGSTSYGNFVDIIDGFPLVVTDYATIIRSPTSGISTMFALDIRDAQHFETLCSSESTTYNRIALYSKAP